MNFNSITTIEKGIKFLNFIKLFNIKKYFVKFVSDDGFSLLIFFSVYIIQRPIFKIACILTVLGHFISTSITLFLMIKNFSADFFVQYASVTFGSLYVSQ